MSTRHKEPKAAKNIERRRNGVLHGKARQLVIQYQIASPEKTHTNSIIQTGQDVFMHLGIYPYICIYCTYVNVYI